MGKHDKKEPKGTINPETRFSWQPMPDEFYKERIKTLEAEIAKLKEELIDTQHNLAVMTSLYEQGAESLQRSEARSDAIIEQKNEEIEQKNEEIDMAKEAIYLAAMREVSMR